MSKYNDLGPLEVYVVDGNIEKAYKILKKKLRDEEIMEKYFEQQVYEKKSDRKRRKKKKSIYERQKENS